MKGEKMKLMLRYTLRYKSYYLILSVFWVYPDRVRTADDFGNDD